MAISWRERRTKELKRWPSPTGLPSAKKPGVNAIAIVPSVSADASTIPGDVLEKVRTGAPGLIVSWFPDLLGGLLHPQIGQKENGETEKKQETQNPLLGLAAPSGIPAPPPVPRELGLSLISLETAAESQAAGQTTPVEQQTVTLESCFAAGLAQKGLPPALPTAESDPTMAEFPELISVTVPADALPATSPAAGCPETESPQILIATSKVPPAQTVQVIPRIPDVYIARETLRPEAADAQPAHAGQRVRPGGRTGEAPSAPPAVPNRSPDPPMVDLPFTPIAQEDPVPDRPPAAAPELKQARRLADSVVPEPAEPATLPGRAARRVELAFSARLSPLERGAEPHAPLSPQGRPAFPQGEAVPAAEPAAEPAVKPEKAAGASPATSAAILSARTGVHLPADFEPARMENAVPIHNPSPQGVELTGAARGAEASTARPDHVATLIEPQHPAAAAQPEPAPSSSLRARDIRVQVNGGAQRVDVRLTEHRGEVQVAVRTADSRLTEALRSDLPVLSARLEQNGFRAETWHPAALRTEHYEIAREPSSSQSTPQGQGGERQGAAHDHEPPPRRAPASKGEEHADSSPQEFSWLFSSVR